MMKKRMIMMGAVLVSFLGLLGTSAHAQMMGDLNASQNTQRVGNDTSVARILNWDEIVEHTFDEEQEGREVWGQVRSGALQCDNLTDEQFGVLGEYFMGEMAGERHSEMNAMLMQMHGMEGEEKIHVALGKRLSDCNPSATFGTTRGGWMPMMGGVGGGGMMGNGWSENAWSDGSTNGQYASGMMGSTLRSHSMWGSGHWLTGFIFWALIILGLFLITKLLVLPFLTRTASVHHDKPLDTLKARYARGEITKETFDAMRKDVA